MNRKAFTLVELLVVIAIIAIMAAMLTNIAHTVQKSGKGQTASLRSMPKTYVTDLSGLLSHGTVSQLNEECMMWDNPTGGQLLVFVDAYMPDGVSDVDSYAQQLFEAWKPGSKGSNKGVLFVVLTQQRKMCIRVGYGMEDTLSDVVCKRILSDVVAPHLKLGHWDDGISAGVSEILSKAGPSPKQGSLGYIMLAAFGFAGLCYMGRRARKMQLDEEEKSREALRAEPLKMMAPTPEPQAEQEALQNPVIGPEVALSTTRLSFTQAHDPYPTMAKKSVIFDSTKRRASNETRSEEAKTKPAPKKKPTRHDDDDDKKKRNRYDGGSWSPPVSDSFSGSDSSSSSSSSDSSSYSSGGGDSGGGGASSEF